MGNCKLFLGSVIVLFVVALSSSEARRFRIGDGDGWVVNPRESFNHWAERNRFQINDTVVFKYKKGSDSVLVVTRESYDACDATNPLQTYTDGNSEFTLGRSGSFYFISGNTEHCGRGQKLIIVVLAARHEKASSPPPAPPAAPIPSTSTPSSSSAPSPVSVISGSPSPSPAPNGSSAAAAAAAGFGSWVGLAVAAVAGLVGL
ncbi:hypothetical protein Dimus_019826 [Dionaea muscipula]